MRLKKLVCMLLFVSILFSGAAVHANVLQQNMGRLRADSSGAYTPEETVTFIVEVEGTPSLASQKARAMGAAGFMKTAEAKKAEVNILKAQTDVIRDITRRVQPDAEKGYTYTALFNGFSMEGRPENREAILALPGVKNVYISQKRYLKKPNLASAGELTGVPETAEQYNLNGEGRVVAIIDSEFDTGHEFFSEPIDSPKYSEEDITRILSEKNLNVDSTKKVYKNSKIPFAFDYVAKIEDTFDDNPDTVHGAHAAGIAAGKNGKGPQEGTSISGVAPEAQMILMKVSDQNGALIDAAIIAALDDASQLGVSVINLSLGADYVPTSYEMDYPRVLGAARDAGIFLSVSAGNSSRGFRDAAPTVENIDYAAAGVPNGYSMSTSVASADNLFVYKEEGKLILPNGTKVPYTSAYPDSEFSKLFAGGEHEFVFCGLGAKEDFEGKELTGKIALVERGILDFTVKSDNAKEAGAKGIIIWNNVDEDLQTIDMSLPGALVSLTEGAALHDAEDKTITVTAVELTNYEPDSAGRPSSFTSWGTSEMLELKPEIAAPGGYIYSSVPNNKYQFMNGTSMAAFYDGDDRLVGVTSRPTTLLPAKNEVNWEMDVDTENAVIMKIFFWDQLAAMRPLTGASAFDIP